MPLHRSVIHNSGQLSADGARPALTANAAHPADAADTDPVGARRKPGRGREPTIRVTLLLLILGCVLPVWAFAGFLIVRYAETARAATERNARDLARATAADVDRELTGVRATLRVLASSVNLQWGDLAAFHRQAAALLADGIVVVLSDASGQELLDTGRPYGQALPPRQQSQSISRAVATGKPQVSNLFGGAGSQPPTTGIDMPVHRGNAPDAAYVLSVRLGSDFWAALLQRQSLPPGWMAGLFDRRGLFIARTLDSGRSVGSPAARELVDAAREGPDAWLANTGIEGQPLYTALERSQLSGWTAAVSMPRAAIDGPLRQLLLLIGAGGLVSLALSLLLAGAIGSRIARPLTTLSEAAAALGRGAGDPSMMPHVAGVREVSAAAAALTHAAGLLRERERDRDSAFRFFVEGVRDYALIMLDPEGRIVSWNSGAERIKGYTADEIVGRHFSTFYPPEDAAAGNPERELRVAREQGRYEEEGRRRRKDGSEFTAHVILTAIHDDKGHLRGFGKVTRDITERKRAEEALRTLNRSLEERGRELERAYAALEAVNEHLEAIVAARTADLREANEEIQRFAYIVSHDLRAPLVNIMGFTSELQTLRATLAERLAAPDAAEPSAPDRALVDEFAEALDFIKQSTAKMDRLIGAILRLSREGRRAFAAERVDMNEILAGIIASLKQQCDARGATIRVGPLPDIVTDRLAVEQVFTNLVDNAVKYLVEARPGRIEVTGREEGADAVTYEIRDNGRGIDPKDKERIFELFRRSGVQDRPGEGIGLAHVRALVRRLGGKISYESELGRGSTFRVRLPKALTGTAEERRS